MMLRLGLPLLAAIGLLVPGNTHAQSAALSYTPPSQLVLHVSDMPAGFKQTQARAISNAQSEKDDHYAPGTLQRHGRLATFEADFQRTAVKGLLDIDSAVAVYRSQTGARWQMQDSEARARKSMNGSKFQRISVGSIGDQAVGYQWTGMSKGVKLVAFAVIVRHGRYVSLLSGIGIPGTSTPGTVVHLAHVVDARMNRSR